MSSSVQGSRLPKDTSHISLSYCRNHHSDPWVWTAELGAGSWGWMKTVFSRVQSKRGRRLASASSLHMYPIAYIQPTCTHTHVPILHTQSLLRMPVFLGFKVCLFLNGSFILFHLGGFLICSQHMGLSTLVPPEISSSKAHDCTKWVFPWDEKLEIILGWIWCYNQIPKV